MNPMITFPAETQQIIEILANAIGISLTLIVFAVGLAEIGARFIRTQL